MATSLLALQVIATFLLALRLVATSLLALRVIATLLLALWLVATSLLALRVITTSAGPVVGGSICAGHMGIGIISACPVGGNGRKLALAGVGSTGSISALAME